MDPRAVPYAVPLLLVLAACPVARAQQMAMAPAVSLPEITVVGTTPLPGTGVDRNDVPAAVEVLTPRDIDRSEVPSLTEALLDDIPSATINDVSGNDFQPDILFRGFTASPVAGTAEGLAVYVDGARFNDPFGDTVNWDLIAPEAIGTVSVAASNPVYGLNALGGSVNVQLKNGFGSQGGDVTGYGGSYGRGVGMAEYGRQFGNFAVYAAGDVTHDGGFRQTQSSDLYRLYTDLGWRADGAELHLGVTAADDTLGNPGASPVQELNVDPSGIFSGPNTVSNKYVAINLNGRYRLSDTTSVQGVSYVQSLTQRVINGATAGLAPCGGGSGALCNSDGAPVTSYGGAVVPDFLHGGPYSNLVQEGLDQQAYGASLQLSEDAPLWGHADHLVVGGSFDGSHTSFNASTLIGGFTTNGSQLFVGPPDYTQVQASEGIEPVKLDTVTRYYGLFFADLFTLAPGLDLTVNGRLNSAQIDLIDKIGTALNGQHFYARFNPDIGLTYRLSPLVSVYGSYAEANRAPTPTELSCSNAAVPCSLLNFFIGDPNLKQVVARTWEGGLRGHLGSIGGGAVDWTADYYHTQDQNDLIFQSDLNNPNLAYYTNAGHTLRQGAEAALHFNNGRLHAVLGYAYTDATFRSPLLLGSASNPYADANGNIHVVPGDRIPGIPAERGTAVVDYQVTDRWTVGMAAILASSQYRYGDEANQTKPVGGYVLVNINTSFKLTDRVTLFGIINNVTDQRYATYGGFGPVGAVPFPSVRGGVTNPQTASPGQPISVYGGVRVGF